MRNRFSLPCPAAALLVAALFLVPSAFAQSDGSELWLEADDSARKSVEDRWVVPERYRSLSVDLPQLTALLEQAPQEGSAPLKAAGLIVSLPLPEGGFGRFQLVESPIMAPELAAKYPRIKTYRGEGLDDLQATARLDLTPAGFHGMILSPEGNIYIDPYRRGDVEHYVSYRTRDLTSAGRSFSCGVESTAVRVASSPALESAKALSGSTLRTYRLAVAATGEYTAFHGGSVAQGQAAIVTAMNRVNGIYEREVAIRMLLVANNDQLVYTNSGSDPYSNGNGVTMLGQNQSNIDSVIGSGNYDIGHVFSTGGGGVASLGVPCRGGSKARGVTGLGSPTGDPFWVDFVAHELGHQWGGNHTFNGSSGSCSGGNRNGSTAYEPGSGTTIMAYAGICSPQNIQPNSDDYFHGISLDEIINYSANGSGNGCAVRTATGNSAPSVNAGAAYTIPLNTPFELCGSATDPNGDALTFAWEEFDRGPTGAPNSPSGNAAIFRTFDPKTSPCRTFPQSSDLLNNTQTLGELLPTYARTMSFRLTARDNRSIGGGVADDSTTVTVSNVGGPFRVTSPNTAVTWNVGSSETVAWNVAGTDLSPISCSSVDITLSTDGGATYGVTLASGVANSGSRGITVPAAVTSSARVRVQCSGNVFFDISNANFSIDGSAGTPPSASISSPTDGTSVASGTAVSFAGSATDAEDGNVTASLSWTSSLDGVIGSGGSFSSSGLSVGAHTITASVTDSDGLTGSDSISLTVTGVGCLHDVDFEANAGGWTQGADSCSTGSFIVGTPDSTAWQVGGGNPGRAFFTQNNTGGIGTDDVDGGTCEALSPSVNASGESAVSVSLDYFHGQRDAGDDANDGFSIELLNNGSVVQTMVSIGDVTNNAAWTNVSAVVSNPGTLQLRVRATDAAGPGDIVEAGIDNVQICPSAAPPSCAVEENFSSGLAGWVNAASSTCSTGTFVAGTPTEQTSTVVTQVAGDHTSGNGNALFTATNSSAGNADVDGGTCVLESPSWTVTEASNLSIWYFHGQRDAGDDASDGFLLEVSTDDGATYSPLVSIGDVRTVAGWTEATRSLSAGSTVRLRVQVTDGAGPGDIVEGGIDDLSICPAP